MSEEELINEENGYKGICRFTCYKPTYMVDEWENGKIIREWDIIRSKEDYFKFIDYLNNIFKENKLYKNILSEIFDEILNMDFAKEMYFNAILRILSEEDDIEKTKQKIKEFIYD